jgi:hypothetical protein
MGCLLVLLSAFAPRLIVVFAWIARPAYFDSVFDTWIFPLLGLIFLPFTTLIWLLVGAPPQGVVGWDWLWVALAVILDLSHYANTYEQRGTVSAGVGRNPSPPTAMPPTNR